MFYWVGELKLLKECTVENQPGIVAGSCRMCWVWASRDRKNGIAGGRDKVRDSSVRRNKTLTEGIAYPLLARSFLSAQKPGSIHRLSASRGYTSSPFSCKFPVAQTPVHARMTTPIRDLTWSQGLPMPESIQASAFCLFLTRPEPESRFTAGREEAKSSPRATGAQTATCSLSGGKRSPVQCVWLMHLQSPKVLLSQYK